MNTQNLILGSRTITAEVVSTPELMTKGLSGRQSLDPNRGMLFLYEEPTTPEFWMKDMNFSIDIVWLKQGKVVGIEQDVPTDDGAVRYSPSSDIDAVLEINAGLANTLGLHIGDSLPYQS